MDIASTIAESSVTISIPSMPVDGPGGVMPTLIEPSVTISIPSMPVDGPGGVMPTLIEPSVTISIPSMPVDGPGGIDPSLTMPLPDDPIGVPPSSIDFPTSIIPTGWEKPTPSIIFTPTINIPTVSIIITPTIDTPTVGDMPTGSYEPASPTMPTRPGKTLPHEMLPGGELPDNTRPGKRLPGGPSMFPPPPPPPFMRPGMPQGMMPTSLPFLICEKGLLDPVIAMPTAGGISLYPLTVEQFGRDVYEAVYDAAREEIRNSVSASRPNSKFLPPIPGISQDMMPMSSTDFRIVRFDSIGISSSAREALNSAWNDSFGCDVSEYANYIESLQPDGQHDINEPSIYNFSSLSSDVLFRVFGNKAFEHNMDPGFNPYATNPSMNDWHGIEHNMDPGFNPYATSPSLNGWPDAGPVIGPTTQSLVILGDEVTYDDVPIPYDEFTPADSDYPIPTREPDDFVPERIADEPSLSVGMNTIDPVYIPPADPVPTVDDSLESVPTASINREAMLQRLTSGISINEPSASIDFGKN